LFTGFGRSECGVGGYFPSGIAEYGRDPFDDYLATLCSDAG
jgi:hypothetical protein